MEAAHTFANMPVGAKLFASGGRATRLVSQVHKANLKGKRSYEVTVISGNDIQVERTA